MFRAILKALTRRFARDQQPCARESLPVSLGPEEGGNRIPEDTAISAPTQSVPANEIPSAEPRDNGKPEDAIPEWSRSAPTSELPSPELNGNGKPGNAPIPERAHGVSEDEIQMRAYLKWEAAGKPKGHESRFWLEAKKELLEEADRASC